MDASLDKNMIDKDEYPATAELEKRCVHILGRPVECAEERQRDWLLDHGIERGVHARWTLRSSTSGASE